MVFLTVFHLQLYALLFPKPVTFYQNLWLGCICICSGPYKLVELMNILGFAFVPHFHFCHRASLSINNNNNGTLQKILELRLCELEIRWRLETVHTMEVLGLTRIPRKVLWIWEDSLSFNVHNSQLISSVNEIGIWHPVWLKNLNERIGKKRNAMKNHLKESKKNLEVFGRVFYIRIIETHLSWICTLTSFY